MSFFHYIGLMLVGNMVAVAPVFKCPTTIASFSGARLPRYTLAIPTCFSNYTSSHTLIHIQSRIRIYGHVGKTVVKLLMMTPFRNRAIARPPIWVLVYKRW